MAASSNRRVAAADAASAGEAVKLYRAIFRSAPPRAIEERIAGGLRLLKARASAQEVAAFARAVVRVGDLEALEVAARYRGRLPLLRDAFRLVVYIAETEPANQHHFVKQRAGRAGAVAAVLVGGLLTTVRIAKGMILLAWVDRG